MGSFRIGQQVRIKKGSKIGQDFGWLKWINEEIIFTINNIKGRRCTLRGDGYGNKGSYGNGVVFVHEEDLLGEKNMKDTLKSMSCRIGDLEVRTCNESLTQDGKHTTAEIIKWEPDTKLPPEYCFTIACWKLGKEGFSLEFIGAKPFEYATSEEFWKLAKLGDDYLQEYFEGEL